METSHIWRVDSLTIRINLGWWTGRWDKPFFLAKPIQVQSFFLQASLGRSSKGGKLSGSQIKLVNQVNLLNCGAQDQEKFGVKLSMRGGCPGRLAQWRWSLVFDHFHHPGHNHQTEVAIALRWTLLSCILCFLGISHVTINYISCTKYPDIFKQAVPNG